MSAPSLTINSQPFGSVPDGFAIGKLTQGNYYATGGELGSPPCIYPVTADDQPRPFVGQDGTPEIRFGLRFQPFTCTLVLAGTPTYCGTTALSLLNNFMQHQRYPISWAGISLAGCKLKGFGGQSWKQSIDGLAVLCMPLTFHNLSFSQSS